MPLAPTAEPFFADAAPDPRDGQRIGVLGGLPMGGGLVLRLAADRGLEVDPSSAAAIRGAVSSRDLSETMLGNSYHVATLDHDAPILFEESTLFIRRVTGP